ncbi:MAG TPA: flagellar biosynthetic protein FliR [Acidimicrobiia bacterium]|jgi:flagellar biosynthetic protein FliR
MTIPIDAAAVTAFILALVRASVFIVIAPPFNTKSIPVSVKAGLAAALSLAAVGQIPASSLSLDVGPFSAAIVTQALVGLVMGTIMMMVMSAVQSAGSLIDVFAGFSIAAIYDPLSDNTASIFGRYYQLIATTLIFATNAHLLIVEGFFQSFRVIPANAYQPNVIARILTLNMGQVFVATLEIAGPVVACLFLTELTMGLVARAAPSLNVFSLAFPVRVGVTVIVVALAIPLLSPAVSNLVDLGIRSFLGH